MRKNIPLILGLFFLWVIIFFAFFGPALAPHDPMHTFRILRWEGTTYGSPPLRVLPPNVHPDHPLGMDRVGRDLLSRLLWAIRPTLLLCFLGATIRVMLGILIGLASGAAGRRATSFIDSLVSLSGAIPILLIAMAVILYRPEQAGLLTFIVALTLTGWLPTAVFVQNRVQTVLQAPFIESAQAIGLSKFQIFRNHVLPQMTPVLPLLLASELSAITLLVTELGYLGLYIGGGFTYTGFVGDSPIPDYVIRTAGAPELGQMISDFFGQVNRSPWEPVFAGSVIVFMICSWTLISEGLRRELDITKPSRRRWFFSLLSLRRARSNG